MARTVFFISDGTGITAETLGHSLLTQFDLGKVHEVRVPFVDTLPRIEDVTQSVRRAHAEDGERPLVLHTIVDKSHARLLEDTEACVVDLFGRLVAPLEREFGLVRKRRVGQAHAMTNVDTYDLRMEATNFALRHDDGADLDYSEAEVIFVGVSRSGKTPTCLYMALQFGVKAANYPLTTDDLESGRLPAAVRGDRDKIFGLTIEPERLSHIREARRPGSRYAALPQCRREVSDAELLYQTFKVPHLNTTHTSVEEICTKVLHKFGLKRNLY
jgi:hypothetical protein